MPTLAQLVTDKASVTLGEGDAALHIEYRPRLASTPAMLKLARDAGRADTLTDQDASIALLDRIVTALCDVLLSWDLQEDDGATSVAITPERLDRIDMGTLATILGTVMGDAMRSLGEQNAPRS